VYCPFYHNKDERLQWDETFQLYINKNREVYIKDKGTHGRQFEGVQDVSITTPEQKSDKVTARKSTEDSEEMMNVIDPNFFGRL
jgi:hypothetical protein